MTNDEILILRPLYQMTDRRTLEVRLDIKEQLKRGHVITIPFGWDVVTKPADTKIEVAEKPEEESTPWDFIDNNNYSPFDSQGKAEHELEFVPEEHTLYLGDQPTTIVQFCNHSKEEEE